MIFRNLVGSVWKPLKHDWVTKVFFSHTNPSNFQRPLQSLLLTYVAENLQVT